MDIKKAIREFVTEKLMDPGIQQDVEDDDSLINSGILDSLTILECEKGDFVFERR